MSVTRVRKVQLYTTQPLVTFPYNFRGTYHPDFYPMTSYCFLTAQINDSRTNSVLRDILVELVIDSLLLRGLDYHKSAESPPSHAHAKYPKPSASLHSAASRFLR
jgi:hypothetical protein